MNPLTSEQITQIAPDAASVKAAKGLGLSKWVLLEQHDHTIWGHCQGSGSNPYQTAVDLSGEPAFKCHSGGHQLQIYREKIYAVLLYDDRGIRRPYRYHPKLSGYP